MAYLIFPRVSILSRNTGILYNAEKAGGDELIFESEMITLPANLTNTDIEYCFDVYCNDIAAGLTTTIVVHPSTNPDDYYQIDNITPAESHISCDGGNVNVRIRFRLNNTTSTPTAKINYFTESIYSLTSSEQYTINGITYTTTISGTINIAPEWFNSMLEVVKLGDIGILDSDVQALFINAKPPPPEAVVETASRITNVDETMQWRKMAGTWIDVDGDVINDITNGVYEVRVKATNATFASDIQVININS